MDRGLWISWYDLPQDGRAAYLSWLHERYLPWLLKRDGYLWAAHYATQEEMVTRKRGRKFITDDPAVPTGNGYILVIGAADACVFGSPEPARLHGELTDADKKMLAMRTGERVNLMTEIARVEGPAAREYRSGMVLAPCIQLGSYNCAPGFEDEMLAWYAQWRLPEMAKLAGCVRTRKLASVSGWAKHAILYEFDSLEARIHFVAAHGDAEQNREWTHRVVEHLVHAPGSANIASRIWPPV